MENNSLWLSITIRLPELLQVHSCILDKGPIRLWSLSSELKLVLACWELTVSCQGRKINFGNDMWYLHYSFSQSIILSIFNKPRVSVYSNRQEATHHHVTQLWSVVWVYIVQSRHPSDEMIVGNHAWLLDCCLMGFDTVKNIAHTSGI